MIPKTKIRRAMFDQYGASATRVASLADYRYAKLERDAPCNTSRATRSRSTKT